MYGYAKCNKCGREFRMRVINQALCYETCVPLMPNTELFDEAKVNRDCIMFHDDGTKLYCSSLLDVYCGYGKCRFYKSKYGKEDAE